ncbi:MAG: type II toxin-antitoxin system HicB family antitoxin [Enterococcaceae bacterium]|jgi:predicted RNase H-like HicB family nuclease|nr:type II toxin-antitoxin system HicB family antitoxin [Enterococcaceae bacterium]MCI1919022.1 type II toxin-antitoxin system HicB family antitoxin [Enterococcaceae bacterium]
MKENILVYPIVISHEKDPSGFDYFVSIPDLDGFTQGKDLADAIEMARDYIGNMLIELERSGKKLPEPNSVKFEIDPHDIKTLVDINLKKFKAQSDNKVIKKTLSIPSYLNELGNEAGINFSQTLTEALKEKLGV